MRVRIVCYEDVDVWILGKFALKINKHLKEMGIDSDIAKIPDPNADINHHIIYYDYNGKKNSIDTVMITHIDTNQKANLLREQLVNASIGICMSNETMETLFNFGLPRHKLSYVNPAHDGIIIPRKKYIGITSKVHEDGRKREFFVSKLANDLNPKIFGFKIMGHGWDSQVDDLRYNGFEIEYYSSFDYENYIKLIPSLDYYLYMGQDEGQMGFIDAVAAGVETIVTPQGYHLDAEGGISYPFETYEQLLRIFKSIETKRESFMNSVSTWNWVDYTKKHVEIWEFLLSNQKGDNYLKPKREYRDGITSVRTNEKYVFKSPFGTTRKWIFYSKKKIIDIVEKEGYKTLFRKVLYKITRQGR
jgi:hypothetical protein